MTRRSKPRNGSAWDTDSLVIRVHHILYGSRANGPGKRNVCWFQGCTLRCPGCFNPAAQNSQAGRRITPSGLAEKLLLENPEGITLSGGEPFQQPEGLEKLLRELRSLQAPPILVFSGYEWEELTENRTRAACLPFIDALICGPYRGELPPAYERFCSSSNQQLHCLSGRLTSEDFSELPLQEVIIPPEGGMILSGIGHYASPGTEKEC